MSSFLDSALKGIKKHPEIFSALEEFERTKKIPKFSYRKRLDVTINDNILREFKEHCSKNGLNMSRIVEKFMIEELRKKY
ncbi:hypothetical protein HY483_02215 [Candidatus Woesearchaeota archaeon]|nr:hypothetical protein [Candidatus Woesearchaeota archaeon]